MKTGLFGKKKSAGSYDRKNEIPVIRCSICNGEQVAGFLDVNSGAFREDVLIRDPAGLKAFKDRYGITEEIKKIY